MIVEVGFLKIAVELVPVERIRIGSFWPGL
jgi:hypothetical protein